MSTRMWHDPDRSAWNGDEAWPLPATLWYPAAAGAVEEELRIGPPGLPFFRNGWVAADAPMARSGSRPLVVLSHGTGGNGRDLSWLAEHLAARGYIVAAATHHGNSILANDLTVEGFFLFWERAREMRVLIDRVLADARIGPHVDRRRIGVAGFSLGGQTSLLLSGARLDIEAYYTYCQGPDARPEDCEPPPESPFTLESFTRRIEDDSAVRASIANAGADHRDRRIRAAYAMAPAVGIAVSPASGAEVAIPIRIVVGDRDTMAPADTSAGHLARLLPGVELRVLAGVDHYTFLSRCGWAGELALGEICDAPPGIERGDVHGVVASDALAFFERTLR
jgi:predicted dienelactone hydrolase